VAPDKRREVIVRAFTLYHASKISLSDLRRVIAGMRDNGKSL
jgi:hypothetical protein